MINNDSRCDLRRKETDMEYKKRLDLDIDYKTSMISLSVLAIFLLSVIVAM